ncbi:unnamed protein product [Closterium sp. NIES-54]
MSRNSLDHLLSSPKPAPSSRVSPRPSMLATELLEDGTIKSLISEGLGDLEESGGLPSFLGGEDEDAGMLDERERRGNGKEHETATTDGELSRVCNLLMSLFASRSCNSTPRTTGAPSQGVAPSDLVARRRTDEVTLPKQQNVQANRGDREAVDLWRNLPHLRTRPPQQRASVLRESQEHLTTHTQPGVRDDILRPSAGILEKQDVANLLDAALAGATQQPDETKWKRLGEGLETLLSGLQDHQKEESVNYLMHWLQQVTEEQDSTSIQDSDVAEYGNNDFRATFLQQLEVIAGIPSHEVASGSSYCDPVELVGSFGELSEGPAALNDSGTELYASNSNNSNSSDGLGRLACVSDAPGEARRVCNLQHSEVHHNGERKLPGMDKKASLANVPPRRNGIGRRHGAEQEITADSSGTEAEKSCRESEDGELDEDDAAPVGLRAYSSAWSNVHSVNWLATRRTSEDSFPGNRSSERISSERPSHARRPNGRAASGRMPTIDAKGDDRKRSSSVSVPGGKGFGVHDGSTLAAVQASSVHAQRPRGVSGSAAAGELSEEEGPYPPVPQPQLLSQDRSISLSSFLTDFSSSDAGLPDFALSPLKASPATSSHGSQPQSDNGSPRLPPSDDDLLLASLLRKSTEWGKLQSSLGYETGAVASCSSTSIEPGPSAQLPILPPPPSTLVPPGLAASLTASPHPWSSSNSSASLMAASIAFSPPLPSSALVLHEPDKPSTLPSLHTLTLPQNLLSFSNPSASSDSEAGSPLHRSTKSRESLHSFSDPDVPLPMLQSTSMNSQAGEGTSGLLHKEETPAEERNAATAPATSDTRTAMVTGFMGNVGADTVAGTSAYADIPGPSSSRRTYEISGMGLLSGGGITWDETEEGSTLLHLVGEADDVRDGVFSMESGGSLDAAAGGSDGLENWDGKANGDGGPTVHLLSSGVVSEAPGAAASTVQSGGSALGAEGMDFELIQSGGRNKVVAEEATPRLSAVLQVLQSARQKIRAVTVPPQLQPSATNGMLLDFQETAKSSSLPMPRKSPLGISSHIDHPPSPSTAEPQNPLTGSSVHPLVAVASGGSSEPGRHSSSSHTASKLRQPVTAAQSRNSSSKKASGSGSTQRRGDLQTAGGPGLEAGTKTVASISALRDVVRARREKHAGSSSGRKSSAGDSKEASGADAAANAGASAAMGAATSLDVAYYEDKGFQSGSGSERSRSTKSRRAGSGVGSRSSRSGEKQAGKVKMRSDSVAMYQQDVSTADEADESIVPLRRSKHSSSNQRSSPGVLKQGRGEESWQSRQSSPLKHAGSSK